jgi:hypothetical protein
MNGAYGFHTHKVVTGTEGDISGRGYFKMVEVTSTVDTLFYPNAFNYNEDGTFSHPKHSDGIPIKAGVPKVIPMAVYNFKADAAVTVVAFGA